MPAGTALFTETWPGANGTAWPDVFSSATSSASTVVDTDTGHGRIKTTGAPLFSYLDYGISLYDTGTNRNLEIAFEFQWGATTEQYMDISWRRSTVNDSNQGDAPNDGYCLEMQPATAAGWWLQKQTAGAGATVASGPNLTMAALTPYAARIRVIGQTIRIKVWAGTLSSGEPAAWGIDFVDDNWPEVIATDHYVSIGCLGGGAAGPDIWFDNLTIQTYTEPVLSLLGSTTSVAVLGTTAVALTGNALPQVGDTIIVCGTRDNIINDPATGDTATDASGNTYTRPGALASPAGTSTAGAGVVGVMLASTLTTAWTSGAKTVTWAHPSVTSRSMTVLWIGRTTGYRASSAGTGGGTAGTASATTGAGTPATDDIVVGMTAFENSGTQTETIDADTTNGTWSSPQTRAFSGSSATAATALTFSKTITQWKRLTAGGAQTYNTTNSVTLSVDTVSIVAAFVAAVFAATATRRVPAYPRSAQIMANYF